MRVKIDCIIGRSMLLSDYRLGEYLRTLIDDSFAHSILPQPARRRGGSPGWRHSFEFVTSRYGWWGCMHSRKFLHGRLWLGALVRYGLVGRHLHIKSDMR